MPVRSQRGFTIVYVAIFILVFFIMAALAIDLGVAYTARTSAQHAADAAALAGAYTFVTNPLLTGSDRVQTAFTDGAAVAGSYKVLGTQVNITASSAASETCDTATENTICVDEGKRRVSAVVAVPVQTYFGKILTDLLRVRVIAHAEAATNAAGDRCIKPMYISNDAITNAPLGGGTKPKAEDFLARCLAAGSGPNPTTIFDINTGELTQWAQDYIANQKSKTSWIGDPSECTGSGCPIELLTKSTSPNPSQVGIIDFSEGQGNGGVDEALVKCAMERCLQECASPKPLFQCGDNVIGQKTGTTWGQLAPLDDFIGGGTSKYVDSGTYDNGGAYESSSPAVVTMMVWDCRQGISNGTQDDVVLPSTPIIKGVVQVFINKVAKDNAGTTNAFLVGGGSCSGGTSNSSGPGAIPVRLVNK